jgi:tetratricopeptide (TPR) repeat protein
MSFWIRFASGALACWLMVALGGCTPGQGQADEEKEPHFVLGQSRVNAMDYQGAIEAFEESLEVNPRSAAAHYQLAMLFDEKVPDPVAAIYHYEQYLKLDPDAGNADIIRQRIYACKQQLAADVMPLPSTPAAQQQLEKLADQNRQLQAQVDHLNDLVKQWRDYANQLAAARINPAPAQSTVVPQPTPVQPVQIATPQPVAADKPRPERTATTTPRTHTVVAGETAMAICRKSGVKFSALQAANPGVNLSRIRAGQILNLP